MAALALVAALVFAAPSSAAKFKELGKAGRHINAGESCGNCNGFQVETAPSSPSYIVPKGRWKIVAWEAAGNKHGVGHALLRIYRPTGVSNQYEIVKESDSKKFPADEITEHKASIRVRKGDHLGLVGAGGDFPTFWDGKSGDISGHPTSCFASVGSTVGGGGTCGLGTFNNSRVNVAVTLKHL